MNQWTIDGIQIGLGTGSSVGSDIGQTFLRCMTQLTLQLTALVLVNRAQGLYNSYNKFCGDCSVDSNPSHLEHSRNIACV